MVLGTSFTGSRAPERDGSTGKDSVYLSWVEKRFTGLCSLLPECGSIPRVKDPLLLDVGRVTLTRLHLPDPHWYRHSVLFYG